MRVVWGGTFDPIHNGHIYLANKLVTHLSLDKLFLMPCFQAVHKNNVAASPEQRLKMLEFATEKHSKLLVDKREILKQSASFTYNSLSDLRLEIGEEPLCFVIGTDSQLTLASWYRAEDIHKLTNIIVVNRPVNSFLLDKKFRNIEAKGLSHLGFSAIDVPSDLKSFKSGKVLTLGLAEMNISSTDIRRRVKKNEKISHLVSYDVNRYIQMNNLYINSH